MSDQPNQTPPPLPDRPAAAAAQEAAQAEQVTTPGIAGVDDTGVPRLVGELDDIGRGFLSALFDITFTRFITRRLASVFFLVGLVAIGIAFVFVFVGGLISHRLAGLEPRRRHCAILSTIIVVPVFASSRGRCVSIESGVASSRSPRTPSDGEHARLAPLTARGAGLRRPGRLARPGEHQPGSPAHAQSASAFVMRDARMSRRTRSPGVC